MENGQPFHQRVLEPLDTHIQTPLTLSCQVATLLLDFPFPWEMKLLPTGLFRDYSHFTHPLGSPWRATSPRSLSLAFQAPLSFLFSCNFQHFLFRTFLHALLYKPEIHLLIHSFNRCLRSPYNMLCWMPGGKQDRHGPCLLKAFRLLWRKQTLNS